jgi:hypothetical protein
MTRLSTLARWFGRFFSSLSQPIPTLKARRSQALRDVENARRRGDDRDYGRALMVLRQVTHEELRAGR